MKLQSLALANDIDRWQKIVAHLNSLAEETGIAHWQANVILNIAMTRIGQLREELRRIDAAAPTPSGGEGGASCSG